MEKKLKNFNLEKITNILFSTKENDNKSLKKILSDDKINNFDITLDSRPVNIKPEIYYKLLSYMNLNDFFSLIIFSI